jgi:hypothetical protein
MDANTYYMNRHLDDLEAMPEPAYLDWAEEMALEIFLNDWERALTFQEIVGELEDGEYPDWISTKYEMDSPEMLASALINTEAKLRKEAVAKPRNVSGAGF